MNVSKPSGQFTSYPDLRERYRIWVTGKSRVLRPSRHLPLFRPLALRRPSRVGIVALGGHLPIALREPAAGACGLLTEGAFDPPVYGVVPGSVRA